MVLPRMLAQSIAARLAAYPSPSPPCLSTSACPSVSPSHPLSVDKVQARNPQQGISTKYLYAWKNSLKSMH